jgi:hypothetical protein
MSHTLVRPWLGLVDRDRLPRQENSFRSAPVCFAVPSVAPLPFFAFIVPFVQFWIPE